MTIALMILVNNPGSWGHVYPPLLHASWHGVTPTDLVFPFFLFISGVSLYISSSKKGQRLTKDSGLRVLKRAAIIFLIGLALHWFPFYNRSFENLRIMGVLQRIGLAYGIAGLICLGASIRNSWKIGLAILLGYWALLWGFGGPDPYSLETNLVRKVDLAILGESHMWRGFGIRFDPEGLLSTLPAAVSIICGYYAGWLILDNKEKHLIVKNLLLAGTLAIFAGLAWDVYFPMNKAIWTSSYVLYTAGIASVVLAILIELIDIRKYTRFTFPFKVFGLNPLIIFVFSGVWVKLMLYIFRWPIEEGKTMNLYNWLWQNIYQPLIPAWPKFTSLLFALSVLGLCYGIGYLMYRKNWIVKV